MITGKVLRTRGMKGRRDGEMEGCRGGGMQGWRDAGMDGKHAELIHHSFVPPPLRNTQIKASPMGSSAAERAHGTQLALAVTYFPEDRIRPRSSVYKNPPAVALYLVVPPTSSSKLCWSSTPRVPPPFLASRAPILSRCLLLCASWAPPQPRGCLNSAVALALGK